MRKNIYKMILKAEPGDGVSKFYDIFIVAVAFISLTPLMFKGNYAILKVIDDITVYILFADYIFHWMTYDYTGKSKSRWAFVEYPFTPFAILDLLSLLPSMGLLSSGFRIFRVFRVSKILQYSDNFQYIARVLRREKKPLLSVLYIAIFYVLISGLIMFSYESHIFSSYFDACVWATTTLTTVGYSDFLPASPVGKIISMISSFFGIAVIALPSGIVTAGFVDEIHSGRRKHELARKEKIIKINKDAIMSPETKRYAVVMFIGVLMNTVFYFAAHIFGLPLWLDVTGTAFAAIVLDPAAGLVVGLINNFFFAITDLNLGSLVYYSISASVALIAGIFLKKDSRVLSKRILPAALLVIAVSAVLSGALDLWLTWMQAPSSYWERFYYELAVSAGVPHVPACFWGALVVKIYDTAASVILVALCCLALPKKLRHPIRDTVAQENIR